MGAFIIGGLIIAGTLAFAFLQLMAMSMSDSPSTSREMEPFFWATLGIGLTVGALVISSHWWHFGW